MVDYIEAIRVTIKDESLGLRNKKILKYLNNLKKVIEENPKNEDEICKIINTFLTKSTVQFSLEKEYTNKDHLLKIFISLNKNIEKCRDKFSKFNDIFSGIYESCTAFNDLAVLVKGKLLGIDDQLKVSVLFALALLSKIACQLDQRALTLSISIIT